MSSYFSPKDFKCALRELAKSDLDFLDDLTFIEVNFLIDITARSPSANIAEHQPEV